MSFELPPDCAERFRFVRPLSQGGFGHVVVAWQIALEREVAVKVLSQHVLAEPDAVARFLAEARATSSVRHPHVIEIIDFGCAGRDPWIAYELLAGGSLEKAGGEPIEPARALEIASQVALGLAAAHEKGILHRDLKPANVLEAAPQHFKIIDFGIAKWTGRDAVRTASGLVLGTPAYLAPEVIRGAGASQASDVYSLGIMLHQLLTGSVPFTGELAVVLRGHLERSAPPPSYTVPGLSPRIDEVVRKALEKDPSQRFASALELHAALGAIGPGVAAGPTRAVPAVPGSHPEPTRAIAKARGAPARGTLRPGGRRLALPGLGIVMLVTYWTAGTGRAPDTGAPPTAVTLVTSGAPPAVSPELDIEKWLDWVVPRVEELRPAVREGARFEDLVSRMSADRGEAAGTVFSLLGHLDLLREHLPEPLPKPERWNALRRRSMDLLNVLQRTFRAVKGAPRNPPGWERCEGRLKALSRDLESWREQPPREIGAFQEMFACTVPHHPIFLPTRASDEEEARWLAARVAGLRQALEALERRTPPSWRGTVEFHLDRVELFWQYRREAGRHEHDSPGLHDPDRRFVDTVTYIKLIAEALRHPDLTGRRVPRRYAGARALEVVLPVLPGYDTSHPVFDAARRLIEEHRGVLAADRKHHEFLVVAEELLRARRAPGGGAALDAAGVGPLANKLGELASTRWLWLLDGEPGEEPGSAEEGG